MMVPCYSYNLNVLAVWHSAHGEREVMIPDQVLADAANMVRSRMLLLARRLDDPGQLVRVRIWRRDQDGRIHVGLAC